MRSFSLTVCDLQRQRHFADYDPGQSIKTSGAKIWIDLARTALRQWAAAAEEEREAFLLLLLFPPR